MQITDQGSSMAESAVSTERYPYHYVGAGLSNVYLVGVTFRTHEAGEQSADIPCLPALLDALVKALLTKKAPLTGDEIRFLRKRLKIPSKVFACLVGKTPETYSRLENGAPVTPMMDRLVRFAFAARAKLPDVTEDLARTPWSAALNHEERIVACQDGNNHWVVQTTAA